MAKRSLLKLTQEILNELISDEVNSISDTPEAMVVAGIIQQCYYNISLEMELPSERKIIALQPYSSSSFPNYLKIPENVSNVLWLKYDARLDNASNKNYQDVTFMDPATFVTYISGRPSTDTINYQVIQYDVNVPFVIGKYAPPLYWTSFDDLTLIFDSYNSTVDSSLQASKSMAYVEQTAELILADSTIPPLPENLFPLLYNTALGRCSTDLKEAAHPSAARDESRFRVRSQRNKWAQGRNLTPEPNYGRK